MYDKQLILSNIDPEVLQQMIREAVNDALKEQKEKLINEKDEELLTRQEVADIYDITLVTLGQWVKDGKIPKPIKKGNRVYFPKSEIYSDIKSKNNN